MAIKIVLFDWDGCLANTLPLAIQIYKACAQLKGKIFRIHEYKTVVGSWERSAQLCGYNNVDEFMSVYQGFMEKMQDQLQLQSGAKQILNFCQQNNLLTCLITASSTQVVRKQVSQLKINNLINKIFGYEDVKKIKPDPEVVFQALNWAKMQPKEALVIGDSDPDLLAAKNAKVLSIWYNPLSNRQFYPTNNNNKLADYTVENFEECKKIIEQLIAE